MKRKVVIKVQINCNDCRIKAMKLVASVEGIDSITMEGENKDQLVLVGDNIDPVCLTHTLRKKVGNADIIKVEEVKKETPKEKPAEVQVQKVEWYPYYPPCPQVVYCDDDYYAHRSANTCSIM